MTLQSRLRNGRGAKFIFACFFSTSASSTRNLRWSLSLLAIPLLVTGCQSSAFRAARLPPEFRAATHVDSTLNLARIASPGSSSSIIAPSDLLEITVSTGRDEENIRPVVSRVAEDGTVLVPVIGPVSVAGMEPLEAGQNVANLAIERGMYLHPLVTIEIKSQAVNRITVLGSVEEPGVHELPRGSSDLVSALAASGGLTDEASTEVEIIRQPRFGLAANGNRETPLNGSDPSGVQLAAYQGGGNLAPGWSAPHTVRIDLASQQPMQNVDYRLNDRDVIRVLPRKAKVIHVSGLVSSPGQFELPIDQDIHLLDALALAGGTKSPVADKVLIIRRMEGRPEPLVIEASIDKAKQNGLENLRLTAGDVVSVERTPATIVVDTIRSFFRVSFGLAGRTVF